MLWRWLCLPCSPRFSSPSHPPHTLAPPVQVVKAASAKFHPLHQWLYFDSIESLPDAPLSAEEVAPQVGGWCGGWLVGG